MASMKHVLDSIDYRCLLVVVGFLCRISHSHTTEICIAVSEDQSVFIGASTYHTDTTLSGGALLTINGVNTRYGFTGYQDDSSGRPPQCHEDGVDCVCSHCNNGCSLDHSNRNDHWQTVTVSDLEPGTYAVTTTSETSIETPCCDPFGSSVTSQTPNPTISPTVSPSPPTESPTFDPTVEPTMNPTADPTTEPTMDPTSDPTVDPTNDPTADPTTAPSTSVPTNSPTVEPTEPVCDAAEMTAVDWHDLFHGGSSRSDALLKDYAVTWDSETFSLTLSATVEYVGLSADGDLDDAFNLGTTYWVDLQSFTGVMASGITAIGSCGNRAADDYDGLGFAEWWAFTVNPADLESAANAERTAYPASDWNFTASDCNTVKYERTFPLADLAECTDAAGESLVAMVESTDTISFEGSFFVELVSPYSMASSEYYRMYPLMQHEFAVELSRAVNTLASSGTKLFMASVVSFGHDAEGNYVLRLLTQSADYVALGGANVLSTPDGLTVSEIEEETTECVAASFLCLQIFGVVIPSNISCADGATTIDFGGTFQFAFIPECRAVDGVEDPDCSAFMDSLSDSGLVVLEVDWDFVDISCGVDLFSADFDSALTFYSDDAFSSVVSDDEPFEIARDTIYGEVVVTVPADEGSGDALYELLSVAVHGVYVCTSSDPDTLAATLDAVGGDGGCLSESVDAGPYLVVGDDADDQYQGNTLDADGANNARFSFLAFDTASEVISVHVQLLLTVQTADGAERRRMLKDVGANQIRHFLGNTRTVHSVMSTEEATGFGANAETILIAGIGGALLTAGLVFATMCFAKQRNHGKGPEATAVHVLDMSQISVSAQASTTDATENTGQ